MLVYGKCECFVMQVLYVCVLCASCGSSQCCVLHDLQFVNAGRGCNRRPYRRGILQSRSHNCFFLSCHYTCSSTGRHTPSTVLGMPGIFCQLSSFLSRCRSHSHTRWRNTSKEIYILFKCWSPTSCYGAACFVQSWVKFAYV